MDKAISELKTAFGERRVKVDEPLSSHTALKIGGPADCYVELDTTQDIVKAIQIVRSHEVPFIVIGSGSKTLFKDSGYSGLVIKNNTRKFDILSRKGKIRNQSIAVDRAYIYADSGAILNQVVRFVIEQGYAGLEKMLGFSGTIGGKLFTDIENGGDQFNQSLYQIQAVSYEGKIQQVTESDLLFQDKKGKVKKGKYIVLSVIFEVFPGDTKTLWTRGTESIEKRQEKRPENPMSFRAFSDITVSEAMSIPTPGYTRSVGYLIENAGLSDFSVGGAVFEKNYPEFLVNSGTATADDMIRLIKEIKDRVHEKYGITIKEAVHIVE